MEGRRWPLAGARRALPRAARSPSRARPARRDAPVDKFRHHGERLGCPKPWPVRR